MRQRIPVITLFFEQETKKQVYLTYSANLTDSGFKRTVESDDAEYNPEDEAYPCYLKGETLSRAISISEKRSGSGYTSTRLFTVVFQSEEEIDQFEQALREGNITRLAAAMDNVCPFSKEEVEEVNDIKEFLMAHAAQSSQIMIDEKDRARHLTVKNTSDSGSPSSPRLFSVKNATPSDSSPKTNGFAI